MKILIFILLTPLIFLSNVVAQTFETVIEPFMVNGLTDTTSNYTPSIIALKNGDFYVNWVEYIEQDTGTVDYTVISILKLKKFNSDGLIKNDSALVVVSREYPWTDNIYYNKLHLNETSSNIIVTWAERPDWNTYLFFRSIDYNSNFLTGPIELGGGGGFFDVLLNNFDSTILCSWDSYKEGFNQIIYTTINNNWSVDQISYIPIFSPNDGGMYIDRTSTQLNKDTLIVCEKPEFTKNIYCGTYGIKEGNITKTFFVDSLKYSLDELKVLSFLDDKYCIIWSERNGNSIEQIRLKKYNRDGFLLNEKSILKPSNMLIDGVRKYSSSLFQVLKMNNGGLLLFFQTDINISCIALSKKLNIIGEYNIFTFTALNEKNFNYFVRDDLLYVTWDAKKENSDKRNVWAKVLRLDEAVGIEEDTQSVQTFNLIQNYPNPFNPSTKIKYTIPSNGKRETSNVKLIVYDILGKEVATLVNKEQSVGNYEVEFVARNLPSGVYFYRLQAGGFVETKKMILLR